MVNKNKKQSPTEAVKNFSAKAGVILMAAATTVGIMDTQNHQRIKVVVPNQPTFAFETENIQNPGSNNTIQREREEVAPHYISYNISQRTPSRHGKI
jgi:hypothetical protein